MKVKELIEILSRCDQDATVGAFEIDGDSTFLEPFSAIETSGIGVTSEVMLVTDQLKLMRDHLIRKGVLK